MYLYSCTILSGNLCVKYACRGYKHFVFSTCVPTQLKKFDYRKYYFMQCRSNQWQFCVHGTGYCLTVHELGNIVVSLNEHQRLHNFLQVQLFHQDKQK